MKKYISYIVMLAMLATVAMTFTACGGDDDDDSRSGSGTDIGVHRIDVQFSGNTAECNALNIFYALKENGSYANLYEGGKALQTDATTHTWHNEEFRNLSIESEDGCGATVASINITSKNMRPISSDLTATVAGYVNGKRIKTQVFTMPAGNTSMTGVFTTSDYELHEEVTN